MQLKVKIPRWVRIDVAWHVCGCGGGRDLGETGVYVVVGGGGVRERATFHSAFASLFLCDFCFRLCLFSAVRLVAWIPLLNAVSVGGGCCTQQAIAPSCSSHVFPHIFRPCRRWCGKWVVSMDEYGQDVVGAKSRNLAALRGQLPDWIDLPGSVTVGARGPACERQRGVEGQQDRHRGG